MAKILVVDDEPNIRLSLGSILADAGHEVIEAKHGGEAFEMACHERPDVILLDVLLPVMDGFQVLKRLRENPVTEAIPVILLTAVDAAEGERAGMSLGVTHYITKPWRPDTVEAAVKVALREAGKETAEGLDHPSPEEEDAQTLIRTGNVQMDRMLGGGIPPGSLILVEGVPSAGKSVLCQHLTFQALRDGRGVAHYISGGSPAALINRMGSFGLDVSDFFRAGQLGIYPLEGPPREDSQRSEDCGRLLALLASHFRRMPGQYHLTIADDITNLVSHSQAKSVFDFFTSCKELCGDKRSIILVARTYAFDERILDRLRAMCDTNLSLGTERMGAKLVNALEVRKLRNAELRTGNTINFELEAGEGLRILPGARVRI